MSLATFQQQYLTTALWSSHDGELAEPLDAVEREWAPDALASMHADAASFYYRYRHLWSDDTQAAHDFWLTRSGAGAGFWDGDWPEPVATRLTEASAAYGPRDVYVGDDNRLYVA